MSVKTAHSRCDQLYFSTFTCTNWINLFDITNSYDEVYKWFNMVHKKGYRIIAFITMPNHLHFIINTPGKNVALDKLVSNGKRFTYSESDNIHVPKVIQRIIRDTETKQSTTSTFNTETTSAYDGAPIPAVFQSVTGFTLEPPGPSTTIANQDRRIPASMYNVAEHSGDHFQNVPVLFNDDVPASRNVLEHVGNYPSNTSGCVLPGCSRGTDNVGDSKVKSDELYLQISKFGYADFGILIQENFPPPPH